MSYGSDISCTDKLVTGRLTSGPMVVVEALYRRLITPRGMLGGSEEESIYGFDVAGYVGAVGTERAIKTIPDQVANELRKDERVAGVSVNAIVDDRGDSTFDLILNVTGYLAEDDSNFEFSVGVDSTSAQFLGGFTS